MEYFSTNKRSPPASFREAVLNGQPDDRGLYFPAEIPHFGEQLDTLFNLTNEEIAFRVMEPYIGDALNDEELLEACKAAVDFDFPLVEISDRISILELFHGPTLAFKDVGARFMSRCLRQFSKGLGRKTVVIVATSGDTGGAVAHGFHNVDGVEVVVLYPKGRVSKIQELQLTSLGGNVITLEVRGSFDDCQDLAKSALADTKLRESAFLTSANSINVARWLPQQLYYLFALKQTKDHSAEVISVPSGNFGNLAAGMLAKASGLPVAQFIAACNANDVIPKFLQSGEYRPAASVKTLSNAMDVGNPSNFVRIMELYGGDLNRLKTDLGAYSIPDDETLETIAFVRETTGYELDPHGAVGYAALGIYLAEYPNLKGIVLETAHPVKFKEDGDAESNYNEMPEQIRVLLNKEKNSIEIDVNGQVVKETILSRI
jgi:threonine synthase